MNEELEEQDDTPKFVNSVDGESYAIAGEFLKCLESLSLNYCPFDSTGQILQDYRRVKDEKQRYLKLPERIREGKTRRMYYPGCILGSWGCYAAEWIQLLRQAELNDELLDEVLYEFHQRGFLPKEYVP